MAGPKRRESEVSTAAVESKQPAAAVGDIVLYAMRSMRYNPDGKPCLIPMMVTRIVSGDDTIDGVLFSAEVSHFSNGTGTKRIERVRRGESEGEWQPRP